MRPGAQSPATGMRSLAALLETIGEHAVRYPVFQRADIGDAVRWAWQRRSVTHAPRRKRRRQGQRIRKRIAADRTRVHSGLVVQRTRRARRMQVELCEIGELRVAAQARLLQCRGNARGSLPDPVF